MTNNKVILISIDGMRPDGLKQCGNSYVEELMKIASYTFDAKTVFPSVTLPCYIDNVKRVIEETAGEYTVIITADHGGHDRVHGTDLPEDMTIPMMFYGPMFEAGRELTGISILDIAPTIADILDVPKPEEWGGTSII